MVEYNNIEIKNNVAFVFVDLKTYPLKVVYSASYVFLDSAYIQLSKSNEGVIVRIKVKKNNKDLEKLANDFLNELIVYADYDKNQEETLRYRETILQRVLLTNEPESFKEDDELLDKEFEEFLKELDEEENLSKKNDSESSDIVAPWENN
jgi:His-Xaa-Ser system protein HxsD